MCYRWQVELSLMYGWKRPSEPATSKNVGGVVAVSEENSTAGKKL